MTKRYLLSKAHKYNKKKHSLAGCFMSEKLDGIRIWWDSGISRGIPKKDVPFSNCEKDERYKEEQIATGLWTQLGNVIHAPDWFLDSLPKIPLSGELYKGRGFRQDLMKLKKHIPIDSEWEGVKIHVYELLPVETLFSDAKIDLPNAHFGWRYNEVMDFISGANWEDILDYTPKSTTPFMTTVTLMRRKLQGYDSIVVHHQEQLPLNEEKAIARMQEFCDEIIESEGEGVVCRGMISTWQPIRDHTLIKVKPLDDAEGIVVGYVTGRKTDKGSKLLGKMGSLVLNFEGKRLELSGFTHDERTLTNIGEKLEQYNVPKYLYKVDDPTKIYEGSNGNEISMLNPEYNPPKSSAYEWARENPETECPDYIEARDFPRGMVISFKHRGFTKNHLPEESHYWRKRLDD